jgi:hypothetical protein
MTENGNGELPLTIHVDADQWAFTNRRLQYLEAVIIQILRDAARLKEWFSAAELASFRLRGLPQSRQGVSRLANARGWRFRLAPYRGGVRQEYHCAALPPPAFADLLDRILSPIVGGGATQAESAPSPDVPTPEVPEPEMPPTNTAPPWVLPLVRCLRGGNVTTVREAVAALPSSLPAGVACPTCEEAETVLRRFGYLV